MVGRVLRATLPGAVITVERSKLSLREANSQIGAAPTSQMSVETGSTRSSYCACGGGMVASPK